MKRLVYEPCFEPSRKSLVLSQHSEAPYPGGALLFSSFELNQAFLQESCRDDKWVNARIYSV
ncbi:hypothetical protein ACHAXN_007865 [Cyclotella atomus]